MKDRNATRRAGFTLAELLVVVALVAIVAAIVLNLKRTFSGAGRFVQALQFSPDGSRVLGLFSDGSARAWSVAEGKQVASVPALDDGSYLMEGAISPDGRLLVQSHYNASFTKSQLTVRDFVTGKLLRQGKLPVGPITFSHDGKRLALADEEANAVRLIEVNDWDQETLLAPLEVGAAPGTVSADALGFSPDDKELCCLTKGEVVRWNLETQQATRSLLKMKPMTSFYASGLAYSADGESIAISGSEVESTTTPGQPEPESHLKLFAVSDLRELVDKKSDVLDEYVESLQAMPKEYSPPSFAMLVGGEARIVSASTLEMQQVVPVKDHAQAIAVGRDGKLIAAANYESIYLFDGTSLRKLVDYRPEVGGLLPLFIAFAVTFVVFAIMRKRRKTRTCVQCGKQWLPVDKSLDERCPDCRVMHQTTEQIAQQVGKQKYLWLRALGIYFAVALPIGVFISLSPSWGSGWQLLGGILAGPFLLFAFFAAVIVVLIQFRNWKLRKYRRLEYALPAARKAAGSEGRIEESGPITVWTDATSLPMTAESIARELDDCRRRLEPLTGQVCATVRPMALFFFANTAAANRFVPGIGNSADHHALYLGPWADLGYVSLEMLCRRLSPLRSSVRSLLLLHSSPTMRRTQPVWLRYGLNIVVASADEPWRRDSWRRTVSVWSREGAPVPLAKLFKQRLTIFTQSASAAMLPENHERMLKAHEQLSSLVDYLCGDEAPPERRQQFAQLWQAMLTTRSIEKACAAAFSGGLPQLESDWKAWAATAKFAPPVSAPPEIAEAAEQEVILPALDPAAPMQERIKRIRALGDCGWSVGIAPLQTLTNDLRPDIQREAKRALQLLLGRVEV